MLLRGGGGGGMSAQMATTAATTKSKHRSLFQHMRAVSMVTHTHTHIRSTMSAGRSTNASRSREIHLRGARPTRTCARKSWQTYPAAPGSLNNEYNSIDQNHPQMKPLARISRIGFAERSLSISRTPQSTPEVQQHPQLEDPWATLRAGSDSTERRRRRRVNQAAHTRYVGPDSSPSNVSCGPNPISVHQVAKST